MGTAKKQITGKQDYSQLMSEFYEETGYIYYLNNQCRRPKFENPALITIEIEGIISGFTNSWPDYSLMRGQLRAALAKIERVKSIRNSQKVRGKPDTLVKDLARALQKMNSKEIT